jgi:peptidoglycan/xylan/chitin deacetylase (PgdA/CDA1 family)
MFESWPEKRPFALGLSHDVDRVAKRWQFLYYMARSVGRCQLPALIQHTRSLGALLRSDDPYWNFPRIMKLDEELGVRSTFFFLDESGRPSLLHPHSLVLYLGRYSIREERVTRIMYELQREGWEIGLHGSYESFQDETLLRKEKALLEHILGAPVKGVRQHYLNLEIPETWWIQAKAGLQYDSSLGFSDRVGLRWSSSRPFYPKDPLTRSEIPVLQLPLAMMDSALMKAENPWQVAVSMIDCVEKEGGVLVIDWHQRVFNPWEYRAYQDMYVRIVRECQRRGAWTAPLGAIADWWQQRHGRPGSVSQSGRNRDSGEL